jgi:hypothetical protein
MPRPSFASVALPHLNAAYNLARWLLRDATETEDAVQHALLRTLRYSRRSAAAMGGRGFCGLSATLPVDRLAAKHGNGIAISLDDGEDSILKTALLRKQDRAPLDALLGVAAHLED